MNLLYHAEKEWRNYDFKLIGIMSKNREEWLALDWANILYNNVMVPLYETNSPDEITSILELTRISTLFFSNKAIENLLKLENYHNLKYIIPLDKITEE